ncbi:MAG: pyridoxal phosphate-dependent aminotransferase [Candidatus Lokiarchaeota archaeon]|nr:pyridoxal phosphate-dependent aminotransferase [Candidatus Lokiarchaeota archaeon]
MKEQKWSFDEVIDRSETQSTKWDYYDKDLLPLWVADMDFRVPQPIINAIIDRAKHGIFGYSYFHSAYFDAVLNWFKRRYNWEIKKQWLAFTPGVIPAINMAIQSFSNPGDKIIVQNPVYYPFFGAIKNNGRQILHNPLNLINKRYQMDFDDLKQKIKDPRAKILILCNPHNPVGRVWTRDELITIGKICIENEILIISDEIHCDLIHPGFTHTNFANISNEFAMNSITCTSLSKTFNLAGLQLSNIIIPNQKLRHSFLNHIESVFIPEEFGYLPNDLSLAAFTAAHQHCDEWLNSLLLYLNENLEFLKSFLKKNLPQIEVIEPEGTYLVWLNFGNLGIEFDKLENFLREKAKIALDDGSMFGSGGEGFQRINIACPQKTLKKALEQILNAVKEL